MCYSSSVKDTWTSFYNKRKCFKKTRDSDQQKRREIKQKTKKKNETMEARHRSKGYKSEPCPIIKCSTKAFVWEKRPNAHVKTSFESKFVNKINSIINKLSLSPSSLSPPLPFSPSPPLPLSLSLPVSSSLSPL